jgi:hypothetical protein
LGACLACGVNWRSRVLDFQEGRPLEAGDRHRSLSPRMASAAMRSCRSRVMGI